ncbi:MAG: hypothetical protein OCD00_15780 [Colwellia sp.]
MLVTPDKNLILEKIFLANIKDLNEPRTKRFRVENYELKDSIDSLLNEQLIKEKEQGYRLTLNGFAVLKSESDAFLLIKSQCQAIFTVLKAHYIRLYDEPITIDSIAKQVSTEKNKLLTAIYFVSETSDLTNGRSNDFSADDAMLCPYEKVLDHENFESALDKHRGWIKERLKSKNNFDDQLSFRHHELSQESSFLGESLNTEYVAALTSKKVFVDSKRITALEELNHQFLDYDLSKVIQICHEMNNTYTCESYYALASLQRMLIDHIPPLFSFKSFAEVASQYGSKSFKKHMTHLDKSLRNISDSYLHQHIRKIESIPTEVSVNFSNAIDELLGEITRYVKSNKNHKIEINTNRGISF